MRTSFYSYRLNDLEDLFLKHQLPVSGASRVFHWFYKLRKQNLAVPHLAKKSLEFIQNAFDFSHPQIDLVHESEDRTVKFLFRLKDGKKVESVLIPFNGKYSICLSSQVGCGMNCSFCHTGTQGLSRNLETHEIVGQFLAAQAWLTQSRPLDDKILNIVFMGQGEPLHNFDAVKLACEIFLSRHGLCLADHKITISTAGYLPGLMRWKEEMPEVNIALSFHSPIPEKRNELIPINRRYPLSDVMKVVETIPKGKKRFVTYEYLLIEDFNDTDQDAHLTGQYLQEKNAYISLIPFNPFPGSKYKRPSNEKIENFKEILDTYKIPTLIRVTKGDAILAACGQLNSRKA